MYKKEEVRKMTVNAKLGDRTLLRNGFITSIPKKDNETVLEVFLRIITIQKNF